MPTETGLTLMIKINTKDTMTTKEIGSTLETTITTKTITKLTKTTTIKMSNIRITTKIITMIKQMIKDTLEAIRLRTN